MSRVLRAAPLMLNEQSNILTSTEKPTTSKADPPDWGLHCTHPSKATPCPAWHWPAIWNHRHTEDSCGFQWRDMDVVTPEFPLDLHNTSPEYYRHCRLLYDQSCSGWVTDGWLVTRQTTLIDQKWLLSSVKWSPPLRWCSPAWLDLSKGQDVDNCSSEWYNNYYFLLLLSQDILIISLSLLLKTNVPSNWTLMI